MDFPPQIYCEGSGYRVDIAGDGGHRRSKDGSDEQASEAGRQLAHHEEGEDGVGLGHRDVELGRVGLEEGVESCADGEEGDGDDDGHEAVGEDAAGGTLLVGSGEIALDDGLVAGVGDEVVGQSAENDHPPRGVDEVEGMLGVEEEEAELVVVGGNLPEVGGSVLARVNDEIDGGKDGAAHEDDALDDVAPDNGFDTAHGAVEDGDEGHQGDTYIYIDTRDGGHGQRGKEQHESRASYHEDDEEYAGHEAGGRVEAALQIFVGRGDVQAAEERQVVLDDGERNEQDADLHGIVGPVGGVGLGGNRHIGDGAEHGGKDADARRPPGNAAATLEEIFAGVRGTLHEVVTEIHHTEEIEDEHRPVQPTEVGGVGDVHSGDVGTADAGLLFAADDEGGEGGRTCG